MAAKRILSAPEVEAKMEMGLCFVCDKPFTLEHHSAHKNILFVVLENEEEFQQENEDNSLSSETPPSSNPTFPNGSAASFEVQAVVGDSQESFIHNQQAPTQDHEAGSVHEDGAQKSELDNPIKALTASVDALLSSDLDRLVGDAGSKKIFTFSNLHCSDEVRFPPLYFNACRVPAQSVHFNSSRIRNFDPGGATAFAFPSMVSQSIVLLSFLFQSPRFYQPLKPIDIVTALTPSLNLSLSHSLIIFSKSCYSTYAHHVLDEKSEQDVFSWIASVQGYEAQGNGWEVTDINFLGIKQIDSTVTPCIKACPMILGVKEIGIYHVGCFGITTKIDQQWQLERKGPCWSLFSQTQRRVQISSTEKQELGKALLACILILGIPTSSFMALLNNDPEIFGVVFEDYDYVFVIKSYHIWPDDLPNMRPLILIATASLGSISLVFAFKLLNLLFMFIKSTNEYGIITPTYSIIKELGMELVDWSKAYEKGVFMLMMNYYHCYNLYGDILGNMCMLENYWLNALILVPHKKCLLVYAGADVKSRNKFGETAITLYELNQNCGLLQKVTLEFALGKGILNTSGFYALHCAIHCSDLDVVTLFTSNGYNVNVPEGEDSTPLMLAAREGHASVCELLVSYGAHCNAKNVRGGTALFLASRFGGKNDAGATILDELTYKLVLSGVYVEKQTNRGKGTPHVKQLRMLDFARVLCWRAILFGWLVLNQFSSVAILHRKMIFTRSVLALRVLLKWKTLPPKHGT